jgi:amino acid transporter
MLYAYGGPVTIMYTWILVCAFNIVVGLSMAEICSAYPTSGGVYFYAYKLGGTGASFCLSSALHLRAWHAHACKTCPPTHAACHPRQHALLSAGEKSRRLACWVTGWFNMLGQIACSAGVAYTIALLVADFVLLATGTAAGGGRIFSQKMLLIIYAGVLVLMGIINTVAGKHQLHTSHSTSLNCTFLPQCSVHSVQLVHGLRQNPAR